MQNDCVPWKSSQAKLIPRYRDSSAYLAYRAGSPGGGSDLPAERECFANITGRLETVELIFWRLKQLFIDPHAQLTPSKICAVPWYLG